MRVDGQRPFQEERCLTLASSAHPRWTPAGDTGLLAPCVALELACRPAPAAPSHLSVQSGVLFSQWMPLKPVGQVQV